MSFLGAVLTTTMLGPTPGEDGALDKSPPKEESCGRGEVTERREGQADGSFVAVAAEEGHARPVHDGSQIRAEAPPHDGGNVPLVAALVAAQLGSYQPRQRNNDFGAQL